MGNTNPVTVQSQQLPQINALDAEDDLEAIDLDTASDLSYPVDDRPDSSSTPRDVTEGKCGNNLLNTILILIYRWRRYYAQTT